MVWFGGPWCLSRKIIAGVFLFLIIFALVSPLLPGYIDPWTGRPVFNVGGAVVGAIFLWKLFDLVAVERCRKKEHEKMLKFAKKVLEKL